jgi:hypothetical protein
MKPSFFQLACVARSPVYFFCLVFRLSQIDFFLGGKMMLLSKAPLMLIEEAAFDGMCVCVLVVIDGVTPTTQSSDHRPVAVNGTSKGLIGSHDWFKLNKLK